MELARQFAQIHPSTTEVVPFSNPPVFLLGATRWCHEIPRPVAPPPPTLAPPQAKNEREVIER